MKVVIIGDAHGNWRALNALLIRARDKLGVAAGIQVGDLGIDRRTIAAFEKSSGRFELPLFAIDGNHDDHAYIAQCLRRGHASEWVRRFNLHFQPRPSTATFSGKVVGFLGGALHVVRPQQHGLLSGAPNYVRQRQAQQAAELFDRELPSLVVTHSCPSGIGIGMNGNPEFEPGLHEHIIQAGFDPGPADDRGEASLRRLWDQLQNKPKAWAFGHFHVPWRAQIAQTYFACAPAIDSDPAPEVLCWDSEAEQVSHVTM